MIGLIEKEKTATTSETKWTLDPSHSEIAFKVKHLMISNVKGVFNEFGATVSTKANEGITSQIDFWLNVDSVSTNDEKRDQHLKSAEFFDAEKFKKITFKGSKYEKGRDDMNFFLHGDLTMKDITKSIKLDVAFGGVMKDPYGNQKAGYIVIGKINRKEWGLNWNATLEAGGVLVSDEVIISCEVELIKQV